MGDWFWEGDGFCVPALRFASATALGNGLGHGANGPAWPFDPFPK